MNNSTAPGRHDELRDPTDFEDDLGEELAPLTTESSNHDRPSRSEPMLPAPSRPAFHRRAGTGTNLSTNSMSTRKTTPGLGRRTLGLVLMFVTISMWTTSNFMASGIFADGTYSKPFFVTWLNVGFFSVFLIRPLLKALLRRRGIVLPWSRQRAGAQLYSPVATAGGRVKPDGGDGDEDGEDDDDDDDDLENGDAIPEASAQSSRESLVLDESMVLSQHGFPPGNEPSSDKLSMRETARLALEFCLIWFASNYFVSACLQYTTVASSTVLGSTSSIFTLGFGAVLGGERFTVRKLVSVVVCLLGVVLISQSDLSGESDENRGSFPEKSNFEMFIGDGLALAGAVGYGLYTILLKRRVQDENRLDVFMFFGFIGVWDLLLIWPGMIVLHLTGIETFEAPPSGMVWWIIIANGFISLISDVSWTYSMLLTSPLLITVGLSLAIPMGLIGQMVINGQNSSVLYWIGSVIVGVSFLIVNYESKREAEEVDKVIFSSTVLPEIEVTDEEDELR